MTASVGGAKVMTAFRVSQEDLARIDKLARTYRLTRTEFLIRAALGELPNNLSVENKLEALEERIERLEQASSLGGFG